MTPPAPPPRQHSAASGHAPTAPEPVAAPAASSPVLLRVMTWNIHGGIGSDNRRDLDRVLALVERHAPDIVALQEVESRGEAGTNQPFRRLRDALGGHSVEAPTLPDAEGYYGHMLVSRWPIAEARLHDISVPRREPRSAIAATVAAPHGPLRVLATHLGLRGRERRHQAGLLAALAQAVPEPVIALGDFNEWAWRGAVHRTLAAVLPARTRHRTFPARRPVLALDRICCRPGAILRRSWTDRAARKASDHLPVIAEIELSAGEEVRSGE